MNSPSLAELKLKFLREELSRCFALITEAERRFDPSNPDEVKRSLGHVEVAHGSLSNFLSDPERMRHLNDEQQRELRESEEDLRTMLEQSRRSLLDRKDPQLSAVDTEIAVL
jgi:hypothetical protein